MKIEQEENFHNKKKSHTFTKMIGILIAVTVVIVIGILILMLSMREEKLVVSVDGLVVTPTEETFIFTEDRQKVYVSIKDIAPLVSYEVHNGEYKVDVEDTNKMYVEAKDGSETTSFYLNSNLINKAIPDSKEDYEPITLTEPVTMVNGKWYISLEGFMKAFNLICFYNAQTNQITIQTLPYLVAYYTEHVKEYGYDALSEEFYNQKALVYGMLVASKESTGKFGVVNTSTRKEMISPRYNSIKFLESENEFIITNASEKVGIAYANGDTKISVKYDAIKVFNSNLGYYLVSSNDKYGIIDSNESLIIHIEYDKIGIDTKDFASDEITSQYMLYEELIPVSINKKWGFFDKAGKKVTEIEYDTIGCLNKEIGNRVVGNVITIGDTEVVVLSKDKIYGGISTKGDLLIPIMFEAIYSITSEGETNYYLLLNGVSYSATDYINRMKEIVGGYEEIKGTQENQTQTETNETTENAEALTQESTIDRPEEDTNSITSEEEKQKIAIFNSMFEAYSGQHSKNTTIALLDTVINSNSTHENKVQIEYQGVNYTEQIEELKNKLSNNVYTITIENNQDTGYIEKIILY